MAIVKLMETKNGRRYFDIRVSCGKGKSKKVTRWYWPDGMSKRVAEREANKVAALFEADVKAGRVLSRAEKKERDRQAAEAWAMLKTVRQYGDCVFMATKEITFSENSRASYRMFLEHHIYPVIGDLKISEVTTAQLKKLMTDFQKKGYSHATTVKLYNILNGLFDMAFMDDTISNNPMLKVKRPTPRKDEALKSETEKAMTVQEVQYMLSCLSQEPLKWQAYINLALDTGCRRGELCALQWQDYDEANRTITVRRNLQYTAAAGPYVTTPKNGKERTVDIGEDIVKLLNDLKREQAKSCISKWIFNQDGTPNPMHPQTPTRYFSKFGKKYNIPDFHPHKLRHSYASIALTHGADVVSVSERLGHSDTAVTLRMYAHANEESIRIAGQIARDAIKQNIVNK